MLKNEISTYYSLLTPGQKKSVLFLIKSFVKTDKKISVNQYNKEIDAAESRIKKGKYISQQQLEKRAAKW